MLKKVGAFLFQLGLIIALSGCSPVKVPTPTEKLMKAAQKGDAIAQNKLGEAYMNGKGMRRDPSQAYYWWGKSAEQGNADAKENMDTLGGIMKNKDRPSTPIEPPASPNISEVDDISGRHPVYNSERQDVGTGSRLWIWDGFRGVEWGSRMRYTPGFDSQDLIITVTPDVRVNTRTNEKMSIGDVPLKRVGWVFEDGMLSSANVGGSGSTHFRDLKAILEAIYGRNTSGASSKARKSYECRGKSSEGREVTIVLESSVGEDEWACHFRALTNR